MLKSDDDHWASLLESLLDEAKGDEAHPAMALVDIVGDLIANHE